MAKSKKPQKAEAIADAPVVLQPITDTIRNNYMPYVMSVIVSRAIPEIDGLKPAHRKLLYTMYKMGLLNGNRTKSANVVGQTMKLNPHGDASIYETMVRLTRGHAALLHPLVDSKGSFGKQYSSDMKYAASRYTEVKLDDFCSELFRGIDKNAVDMIDNYDNTLKEPALLPTAFPNILVTPNAGIAVGMASNICSFNLGEVCDGTIALLQHPGMSTERLMEKIKAPDFAGGGIIVLDPEALRQVFETGTGSIRVRSRYVYEKDENCIDIIQIPYSTSIEQIMDRISDMVKLGKLREVVDFRDEIDLNGFKLTLDLRKGVDPDRLMEKLFKYTPLEDSFKCNFNVLIDASPRTMGVREILTEWIRFRMNCVKRELTYDLGKKNDKLHLLMGLGALLVDIDKAIRIIRHTEKEADVVPNLMEGFHIDDIQANYIADIKLRNLNREYIVNRLSEMEDLQKQIKEIEETLADELKQRKLICTQLAAIKAKYAVRRRSQIMSVTDIKEYIEEEQPDDNTYTMLYTREGYLKKIVKAPNGRTSDKQMLKDGDEIIFTTEVKNDTDLLFLTDAAQLYRAKLSDFEVGKAALLGDYVPVKIGMDEGEKPIFMGLISDFTPNEHFIFLFANGKGVRVPLSAYDIKSARRKQTSAYSTTSPLVAVFYEKAPMDILLVNSQEKAMIISSELIPEMTTRTSGGNQLMNMGKGAVLEEALADWSGRYPKLKKATYQKTKVPSAGSLLPN